MYAIDWQSPGVLADTPAQPVASIEGRVTDWHTKCWAWVYKGICIQPWWPLIEETQEQQQMGGIQYGGKTDLTRTSFKYQAQNDYSSIPAQLWKHLNQGWKNTQQIQFQWDEIASLFIQFISISVFPSNFYPSYDLQVEIIELYSNTME